MQNSVRKEIEKGRVRVIVRSTMPVPVTGRLGVCEEMEYTDGRKAALVNVGVSSMTESMKSM